jgi:hypothetical protein
MMKGFVHRLTRGLAVLVALWVAFVVSMYAVMCQPPDRFGSIMSKVPMPAMMLLPFEHMWNSARGGDLRVGDAAPDFRLPKIDRSTRVQLSSFRGRRPVVLVFGSYT